MKTAKPRTKPYERYMMLRLWLRVLGGMVIAMIVLVVVSRAVGSLIHADILAYQTIRGYRTAIHALDIPRSLMVNLTRHMDAYSRNPAWSPDGRYLAFESYGETHSGIYLMDFDGRNVRLLTVLAGAGNPTWSPDGRQIAFHYNVDVVSQIGIINADGTAQYALTSGEVYYYNPAWSPDGRYLVMQGGSYSQHTLYVVSAKGGDPDLLIKTFPYQPAQIDPAWSPDGRTIAYFMGYDIHLHPLDMDSNDNQGASILGIGSAGYNGSPAWSPDGTWLAYDQSYSATRYAYATDWMIHIIHVDGTDDRVLVAGVRPAWRP